MLSRQTGEGYAVRLELGSGQYCMDLAMVFTIGRVKVRVGELLTRMELLHRLRTYSCGKLLGLEAG